MPGGAPLEDASLHTAVVVEAGIVFWSLAFIWGTQLVSQLTAPGAALPVCGSVTQTQTHTMSRGWALLLFLLPAIPSGASGTP